MADRHPNMNPKPYDNDYSTLEAIKSTGPGANATSSVKKMRSWRDLEVRWTRNLKTTGLATLKDRQESVSSTIVRHRLLSRRRNMWLL